MRLAANNGRAALPPSIRTLEESVAAGAPGLPTDIPASTYELLAQAAERDGRATAITFFLEAASHQRAEHWSYRRLFSDVTRTANMLHEMGVRNDGVTAIMLPNLPETHVALWGGEATGIVMPINPLLEPSSIASLLSAAGASVLITLSPFPGTDLYEKAVEVVAAVPSLRHVVLVDIAAHVVGPKRLAAKLIGWRARRSARAMRSGIKLHRFSKALNSQPSAHLRSGRRIASDAIASYFCTGGTTGLPKIAVRTHGQEIANAWMAARMMGNASDANSVMFCGLPLFHVNAVIATGLATFLNGSRVVLGTPQGFRGAGLVERFWEIVAHHRISAFSGVPTLLNMLLEKSATGHNLSSFKFAFSGAAPLSPELLRRFETTFGVAVVEAYGLTETACLASMNPPEGEHRAGSVGLPIPAQEIRTVILDSEGGLVREAATDEIGTIAIAGPNVFSGYLETKHNASLWVERGDGKRWLNTGDLGRIDQDGYLWITGRAKDLIIRGGHNIDPSVVEEALCLHPDVALVAAVGRPDAYAGEVPVAFIQLRPGAIVSDVALDRFASQTIGERAAIPKAIIFVDEMPLTPIGKIHKPTLRLRAMEDATTAALIKAAVPFTQVWAEADARRGNVVRIQAPSSASDGIAEALKPFTFAHEVTRTSGGAL